MRKSRKTKTKRNTNRHRNRKVQMKRFATDMSEYLFT